MKGRVGAFRRTGAVLAVTAVGTAGCFAVAEFLARRLLGFPPYLQVVSARNCLVRSALLGTAFRPRCEATWKYDLMTGSKPTTFRTNSLGFRDAELTDDGAARILCLGDSTTWGWGVTEDEAYPRQLQSRLDRRYGAGSYRVINAGVPGYTSHQGRLLLQEHGAALRPAIAIIGYWFNDALPAGDIEEALARQARMMPLLRADDYLLEHSRLWNWLRARTAAKPPPNLPARVPVDRFERNIAEIVDLTRKLGARAMLLSMGSRPDIDPYVERLFAMSARDGIPLVVYRGPRMDIVHPTAEGYSQLADMIFARLRLEGYVMEKNE